MSPGIVFILTVKMFCVTNNRPNKPNDLIKTIDEIIAFANDSMGVCMLRSFLFIYLFI